MTWKRQYLPPDMRAWQGRPDAPPNACFFQIVQTLNLLEKSPPQATQITFAVVGFQCEEGIRRNHGRLGAQEGPEVIRQMLAKLPVQSSHFAIYDVGNIFCVNNDLESAQTALGDIITLLLHYKIHPIVLGGGHEIAWGHYQGILKAFPEKKLGIINFDSHLDMRPILPSKLGNSGTPFLQIAESTAHEQGRFDYNCVGIQHTSNTRTLIETAKKYRTKIIWADDLHQGQIEKCVDFIDRIIDENEIIYLSLCLDVFASAFAPGVSATQPLGLFPWHVIPLIRQLAAAGKVISFDIAEMSPKHDVDYCTAKLAADLIFEFIHHHHEVPKQ